MEEEGYIAFLTILKVLEKKKVLPKAELEVLLAYRTAFAHQEYPEFDQHHLSVKGRGRRKILSKQNYGLRMSNAS